MADLQKLDELREELFSKWIKDNRDQNDREARACHAFKADVSNKLLSSKHAKASQCSSASVVGSRS